ncbi:hypothetical protein ASD07_24055 [Duganella sp. Root336D2]|nr:hypothetical protein ASD07_24055 [Duganella sp. Root336D2]
MSLKYGQNQTTSQPQVSLAARLSSGKYGLFEVNLETRQGDRILCALDLLSPQLQDRPERILAGWLNRQAVKVVR